MPQTPGPRISTARRQIIHAAPPPPSCARAGTCDGAWGMGVVAMGGVDAAPAARRNRQSDPNRAMADGDLSRTHLQVAREGRCRRSHVKLERWPEPAARESPGGRAKGGAGHLLPPVPSFLSL